MLRRWHLEQVPLHCLRSEDPALNRVPADSLPKVQSTYSGDISSCRSSTHAAKVRSLTVSNHERDQVHPPTNPVTDSRLVGPRDRQTEDHQIESE